MGESERSEETFDKHEKLATLEIKNTRWRRGLTLLALKIHGVFKTQGHVCVPLSRHLIVQTGPYVDLTEGATLKYVAEHTAVPVPKVYCSFMHKRRAYIVMERVRGMPLSRAWANMPSDIRDSILEQLKHLITELRAVKRMNTTAVESCAGGSLFDSRIAHCRPRMGPFTTVQDYHTWLRKCLQLSDLETRQQDDDSKELVDMIIKQDGPWPPTVFTHADLNPTNILVHDDHIVAIVD